MKFQNLSVKRLFGRVAGVFESTAPDDQAELQRICTYYFRNATEWRTLL